MFSVYHWTDRKTFWLFNKLYFGGFVKSQPVTISDPNFSLIKLLQSGLQLDQSGSPSGRKSSKRFWSGSRTNQPPASQAVGRVSDLQQIVRRSFTVGVRMTHSAAHVTRWQRRTSRWTLQLCLDSSAASDSSSPRVSPTQTQNNRI